MKKVISITSTMIIGLWVGCVAPYVLFGTEQFIGTKYAYTSFSGIDGIMAFCLFVTVMVISIVAACLIDNKYSKKTTYVPSITAKNGKVSYSQNAWSDYKIEDRGNK